MTAQFNFHLSFPLPQRWEQAGALLYLLLALICPILGPSSTEWSQLPTLLARGDFCQHQQLSLCLTQRPHTGGNLLYSLSPGEFPPASSFQVALGLLWSV